MTPSLVLFDCDGVLVDSEAITVQMLLDDLASRGLSLTVAESHQLFVGGTIFGAGEVAAKLGADIPIGWAEEFYNRLFAELEHGVPLVGGVVALLDALDQQGIATGVVSNGSERKMQITLGPHGLWDRFQGRVFSAHTFGVAKPDPEIVRIALRQFGVAPERAVLIDDSPSGCKAGMAAGVMTVGFAQHSDAARLESCCHHIAHTMAEVRALLEI